MPKTAKKQKSRKLTKVVKETPRAVNRQNDPGESLNVDTRNPNDQSISERTKAASERTKEIMGDVSAPQARQIPLVMSSDSAPGRSGEVAGRSDSRQQIIIKFQNTVRNLRKYNISYGTLETLTDLPKSTLHAWASDVQPEPVSSPNGEQQPPTYPNDSGSARSAMPETIPNNGNGNEGIGGQRLPRLSSEITGTRPRIVEDYNGDGTNSTRSDGIENNGGDGEAGTTQFDSSVDLDILRLLLSRQPAWIDVFQSIKAAATLAGFKDAVRFFYERLWENQELADFFRTAIPHDDLESLRENFTLIVRKANAYDETAKKNGLEARRGMEPS